MSLIHYNCFETVVLFSITMRRLSSKAHKGQFSDAKSLLGELSRLVKE